jgi:hypothetical protein
MRGDVVGDGEKRREAGATQRHTARTVPAAAELGIAREGAGGPAEARGRERVGTWGSGARRHALREQAGAVTCRRRVGGGVEDGELAGFSASALKTRRRSYRVVRVSWQAWKVSWWGWKVSGQVLQPVLGYGSVRHLPTKPAGCRRRAGWWWRRVWERGFAGLPGFWTRVWGVAEMLETLRSEQNAWCLKHQNPMTSMPRGF